MTIADMKSLRDRVCSEISDPNLLLIQQLLADQQQPLHFPGATVGESVIVSLDQVWSTGGYPFQRLTHF